MKASRQSEPRLPVYVNRLILTHHPNTKLNSLFHIAFPLKALKILHLKPNCTTMPPYSRLVTSLIEILSSCEKTRAKNHWILVSTENDLSRRGVGGGTTSTPKSMTFISRCVKLFQHSYIIFKPMKRSGLILSLKRMHRCHLPGTTISVYWFDSDSSQFRRGGGLQSHRIATLYDT